MLFNSKGIFHFEQLINKNEEENWDEQFRSYNLQWKWKNDKDMEFSPGAPKWMQTGAVSDIYPLVMYPIHW